MANLFSFFKIVDYLDGIDTFVNISFYAALAGTLATIILFIIIKKSKKDELSIITEKIKKEELSKAVITVGKLFLILWILNILLNFVLIYQYSSNKTLSYIKNGVSSDIKSGTVLMNKDMYINPRNYNIKVNPGSNDLEIDIWNFAADDGDAVQIYSANSPITQPFKLTHTVQKINVPRGDELQIKGISQGGKAITYAIYIPEIKSTYINSVPVNCVNYYNIYYSN